MNGLRVMRLGRGGGLDGMAGMNVGRSILAAVAVMLLVGMVALREAEASHISKCFGKRADINRSHDPGGSFLVGTSGSDVIIASRYADHIEGRGGRDLICGLGGDDEVLGGSGNDKLAGGSDRDEIAGNGGSDLLKGGPDSDGGNGGSGRDTCRSIERPRSCEVVG